MEPGALAGKQPGPSSVKVHCCFAWPRRSKMAWHDCGRTAGEEPKQCSVGVVCSSDMVKKKSGNSCAFLVQGVFAEHYKAADEE